MCLSRSGEKDYKTRFPGEDGQPRLQLKGSIRVARLSISPPRFRDGLGPIGANAGALDAPIGQDLGSDCAGLSVNPCPEPGARGQLGSSTVSTTWITPFHWNTFWMVTRGALPLESQ